MSSVKRSAHVPYSAQEMYDLVADIESYPQFLPWCGGARIIARDETSTLATIDIAYRAFRKGFTTRNRLQPGEAIEMRLVEGPFKELFGRWRFDTLAGGASRISLDLDFEFASTVTALALGPAFTHIANTLIDSFKSRAAAVYGEREWQV